MTIETHGEYEDRQARLAAETTPATPTPTQVEHPWRAAVRTAFQALVALAVISPLITPALVDWATEHEGILPEWVVPVVVAVNAAVAAVAGLVARLLAIPGVNAWIEQYLSPLAATK